MSILSELKTSGLRVRLLLTIAAKNVYSLSTEDKRVKGKIIINNRSKKKKNNKKNTHKEKKTQKINMSIKIVLLWFKAKNFHVPDIIYYFQMKRLFCDFYD